MTMNYGHNSGGKGQLEKTINTYIQPVDPKLVRMTVGYGINHTPTKIYIPYN
jgi:hypothetical protein